MDELKILIVEDLPADAEIARRSLKKEKISFSSRVVDAAEDYKKALAEFKPDLIVSDYSMPGFDGLSALKIARSQPRYIPFILLTGSVNEETAVACMKAGADDYVLKEKVRRLPFAVREALQKYKARIEKEQAEENLRKSEAKLQSIFRVAPTGIGLVKNRILIEVNPKICEITGYQPQELTGKSARILYPSQKEFELVGKEKYGQIAKQGSGMVETRWQKKDGTIIDILLASTAIDANDLSEGVIFTALDFTDRKKAEEALHKSEAKYRLLAENSGDVISTLDFELNYTYISPAIYAQRGYRPEEIINRNITETLTPASGEKVKQLFDKYIPAIKSGNASAEPLIIELEVMKKDGSTIWVEVKLSVLTDSMGKPVGVLGVSRDISKRKAAQDELRKLSRAVNQSPDSIVITDVAGTIEYVNPKFTQITGYNKDEVLGKNPRILNSGEQPKSFYKELWDTILSGKDWYGEFHNKKKNGELYWESASISTLMNNEGEITHIVAVKEDITERKKFIEDLKTEKEKAQAADRLKTAFLNNISHEVRTPLNGILGFGEMMAEADLSQEEKKMYLKILKQSSDRLVNTITDFMDISLVASDNIMVTEKKFAVTPLLNELGELYGKQCKEKGLEFELNLPSDNLKAEVESDPELLKKVFRHLLNNALKFTSEGTIKLGYTLKKDAVECFIEDTGIGIEKEMQDLVFNHFSQEDTRIARGFEGSGLGLSISKGLVEILGGEISLKSEKGKGTTVSVTLPRAPKEKEHETPGNSKQIAGGKMVLIAEDDSMNRLYLETILKSKGIPFISVENGQQAVDKCRENQKIGIVLMDLKMPVMDGVEATRQIKALKPELPVIAITAQAMQGDRKKALKAGCDDYIAKPINKNLLLEKITQLN